MKILFISHKYPPTIGGMEKQCFELISHASKLATVHQLVHTGEGEHKAMFFIKLRRRVKKILQKHPNIDIIHLNDGLMGLFGLWLKSYTNIPVVVTFHGLDLVFPNGLYQRRIKYQFTKYDGLICVSTATAQAALDRGFSQDQVFVVPNGVDHDLANFTSDKQKTRQQILSEYGFNVQDKKVLITLGRPVKRKGFSWFLQHVVPKLDKDIIVLMVGPLSEPKPKSLWSRMIPTAFKERIELLFGGVNDEQTIRDLLKQPAYQNRVLQTGKVPFQQLLAFLQLADLFVMPNIKMEGDAEGFGLVALEASLCQTVVLASELEGIPEAIQNNKNGYLLPSKKENLWLETIEAMLSDSKRLDADGKRFQQFTLENYGWEKMTKGYLEVFKKIIQKTNNVL